MNNRRKLDVRLIFTILTTCGLLISIGYNVKSQEVVRDVEANATHIEEIESDQESTHKDMIVLRNDLTQVKTKVDIIREEQKEVQSDIKEILRTLNSR